MSDLSFIALCAVGIFALGALAQAVSGFGGSMVAVPLLVLVVDPVTAVVSATGVGLGLSGLGWFRERSHVVVPLARRLAVAGFIGMPVGLAVLLVVQARTLGLLISVLLALTVVSILLKARLPATVGAQWGAGVLSGAMLTSTGLNGPPLVVCLRGTDEPPRRVRATLQSVFTVQDAVAVVVFVGAGAYRPEALVAVAAGLLGVRLGWTVGDRIFHRLSPGAFNAIVLCGLGTAAVLCFVQSLYGAG